VSLVPLNVAAGQRRRRGGNRRNVGIDTVMTGAL